MKIYTSYFYQIRFFPKNLVPLSTAASGPAWFYPQHKDKRDIYNGIKAIPFVPQMEPGLCIGKPCSYQSTVCPFMNQYRQQLYSLNFDEIMKRFDILADKIKQDSGLSNIDFALMVHEAPQNECSERKIIQEWFSDHGYPITEWHKEY